MSRRTWTVVALALGSAGGVAGAQNLDAYRTLARELDAAAQSSGRDRVQTLGHLDAAQGALEQLAPTLSSAQVVGGLRDTLEAARAAQSRTATELQAQVLLARGLMRKALYDQTVTVLASTPANGTERLRLLATELGADPQALLADARAGRVNRVTWRLQKVASAKVSAALAQVTPQQSAASYLNLARASSWFTVVQDTGRALTPPLQATQFQAALTQLASGDLPGLENSLTTLRTGVGAMNRTLATLPQAAAVAVAPAPAAAHAAAREQAGSSRGAANHEASAASHSEGASSGKSGHEAAESGSGKSSGLSAAYAALGRALTAAGHADLPAARQLLAGVPGALAAAPANVRHAAGYDAFVGDAQALSRRPGLRPADVQALTAELGTLENRAAQRPLSTLDNVSGSASRTLGGALRAVLGLVLALLCAAPLYLLNLAFGGRNPFWRAIGLALTLLMLPAMLEGVFGFLGWLGDLLSVPPLRSLTNLTLSQGAYGLPVRGLLTLLAVALATYGFRGLCIQFGLLGGRPSQKPVPAAAAAQSTHTSFDWDEEV